MNAKSHSAKSNLKQKNHQWSFWKWDPFPAELGGLNSTLQERGKLILPRAFHEASSRPWEARRVSDFPPLCSTRLGTGSSLAEKGAEELGLHEPVFSWPRSQPRVSLSQCPEVPGNVPGRFRGLWLRVWAWVHSLSSASFPCPPQGWPEGSASPGPAVSLLCLGRKPAAVWWLTLALALGGEVRLGLLTRRPGVFCIFCSVSTVCTHGAKALCQMDSRVHLTLGWSLLQRGASAGTLVPENLFPRVWKATGLWEHLMIERDQHHVCTFSIPPQTTWTNMWEQRKLVPRETILRVRWPWQPLPPLFYLSRSLGPAQCRL